MGRKPILCLDFDGVVHQYLSGWKAADIISDPPMPGAREFIESAQVHFEVAIYSSRSGQTDGIRAMREFCYRHFGDQIAERLLFPTNKPPALVTLDDRAIQFKGTWPRVDQLLAFKPWKMGQMPEGED